MSFVQKRIHEGPGGFGHDLAELRELRGYTRESLGRLSGIHPAIIAAFEEERLEDVSDPAYAERHVRTLARLLETRQDFLLKKYRELMKTRGISNERPAVLRSMVRRSDFFVTSRAFVFAGFLLVVAILAGYVIWQAALVTAPPVLTVASPTDGAIVDSSRVEVVGLTDPTAAVTVNAKPAIVDADGAFKLQMDIPRGVSVLKIIARRRYSSQAVIERHVQFTEPPSSAATTTNP